MAKKEKASVKHYAKAYIYPCGIMDLLACSEPVFCNKGWEAAEDFSVARPFVKIPKTQADPEFEQLEIQENQEEKSSEDLLRSMRRAKAKLRRIALSNPFRYFVTLTLDPQKVDRCDGAAVIKKLNAWASNMVQRYGLRYVLVPEFHKKGGIHFHGFFNDALPVVDSGTIRVPWAKKPKKPRSEKERKDWLDRGGVVVYNVPAWTLGFTTAMELYGDYPAAVAYVCKYIGKDGVKPAGRWYYSGGSLDEPKTLYMDISPAELLSDYGNRAILIYPPGKQIAVVNGIESTLISTERR